MPEQYRCLHAVTDLDGYCVECGIEVTDPANAHTYNPQGDPTMNAPEQLPDALDQSEFKIVSLDHLVPSATNPRKRFDQAKLRELAASIKAVGVAQPILIRKFPDFSEEKPLFEIVSGERRYRASKLAGLTDMPTMLRDLTNQQVLHIQLIENLQRDDLHPIEEAEGYERLMLEKDANGNHYTAETIAAEIGKSRSYVFQRRKLLALCKDARDAFYEGKLDASTALLIARIPVEKLQLEALQKLTQENGWGTSFSAPGDKMTFRKAREVVRQEFMLDLERAIFDQADAALLPKAGSCVDCAKRTGNSRDLFDDVDDPNICTDTVCFGMKKAAHVLKLQKQAEAEGAQVIKGKEAKKLIPNYYANAEAHLKEHGYATLDTPVPGDEKKRTLGQVLEETKTPVQKTVVANPHRDGEMIETANIEVAVKALREAGYDIQLKGSAAATEKNKQEQAKQREKEKALRETENRFRARLFDALHEKIGAEMASAASPIFPKINAMLAQHMFENTPGGHDDIVLIARKYAELPPDAKDIDWQSHLEEFGESIPNLTPQQQSLLMIDLLMADDLTYSTWGSQTPATMLKIADIVGVGVDGIKREVAAKEKAKAKAEAKKEAAEPEKKPEAKKKSQKAAEKAEASTWPFPTKGGAE